MLKANKVRKVNLAIRARRVNRVTTVFPLTKYGSTTATLARKPNFSQHCKVLKANKVRRVNPESRGHRVNLAWVFLKRSLSMAPL